ncbi:MAG: IS110 family transposase [Acidiferrobacterales bacterium]
MNRAISSTCPENVLRCALELSKNSWLLAIQFPDRPQPSLYPIKGGDTEGLMVKLMAARDRVAKLSGKPPSITLCYEVGYDAFWLARLLKARGIECLVIEPASLQVNRRGRRAKTDRIDVGLLLRALIAWCRGERHVCSMVRIPSIDEEDLRRSHRERRRLIRERTAHINRIKGLLFAQGIRGLNVKSHYKTLQAEKLLTGEGHALPPRLAREIAREIERLALVQEQLAEVERERDEAATPCKATEKKRLQLLLLKAIGPTISAVMAREVYYRQFDNRRQVAGFLGLATSPYDSGAVTRSQGISRAGSGPVRAIMIQAAWLWIKHQPKSALTRWFLQRTAGQSGRIRRIMIVAVARKLAIALWRYLEHGLVPEGAILNNR